MYNMYMLHMCGTHELLSSFLRGVAAIIRSLSLPSTIYNLYKYQNQHVAVSQVDPKLKQTSSLAHVGVCTTRVTE